MPHLVGEGVYGPVRAGEVTKRLLPLAVPAAQRDVRQLGDDGREKRPHGGVAAIPAQGGHLVDLGGEDRQGPGGDVQVVRGVVAEQDPAQFGDDRVHPVLGLRLSVVRLPGQDFRAEVERLRQRQHERWRRFACAGLQLLDIAGGDRGLLCQLGGRQIPCLSSDTETVSQRQVFTHRWNSPFATEHFGQRTDPVQIPRGIRLHSAPDSAAARASSSPEPKNMWGDS